jgi:WhiB family redox-sensing transcriptional regulator
MTDSSVFRRRPSYAPDTLAPPARWGKQAACRTAPDSIFYPEDFSGSEAVLAAEEAKRWCLMCPVAGPCLDDALQRHERFGVWGGLTAPERRALLREQREEAKRAAAEDVATTAA